MRDFAEKELCKELYRKCGLTGDYWWAHGSKTPIEAVDPKTNDYILFPAYTIDLIKKLPKTVDEQRVLWLTFGWVGDKYLAYYEKLTDT